MFVAFWSIVVVGGLIAVRAILVPFVLAALLAYVLTPVVRRMVSWRVRGHQLPRWIAVLTLYIVMLGSLAVTLRVAVPVVAGEVRDFIRHEVPRLRTEVRRTWMPRIRSVRERFIAPAMQAAAADDEASPRDEGSLRVLPRAGGGYDVQFPSDGIALEHRGNTIRVVPGRDARRDEDEEIWDSLRSLGAGHTEDLLRVGRGIVGGIVGGVFGFFITLMLSAYMLLTTDRVFAFAESLVVPPSRREFRALVDRIDRGLSGVVRGQLVICAVNGVLSAVGFAMAKLPYWPLLALMAAIFSLIPIFGSILSSIPAVAIGLRFGVPRALFVLAWILGIHQLEANLLNPKIMGDAAKIHPVLVVFSLIVGEHFFGLLGALLAVPAMSLAQSFFLHWRRHALDYGDATMTGDSLRPPAMAVESAREEPPE